MEKICRGQGRKQEYIVYAISLTGGLYALISSTFWVIPLCLTGGIVLLFRKKYRTLWKLIAASVVAAVMTLFLYTLIWLAIGSNLMSKNPENIYYGVYQVTIILKEPFAALRTGMDYMLATPYIQGDARSYIVTELFSYLTCLFNLFYQNAGAYLTVFLAFFAVWAVVRAVLNCNKEYEVWFSSVYLAVSIVMVPLMLIIQSVQPYYRVFTFFAVPLSVLIVWLLQQASDAKKCRECFSVVCCIGMLIISIGLLGSESYNAQFAGRETEIAEIFKEDVKELESIFYFDDYQKYVLKFYYDKEPLEVSMEEAQYILLPKELYEEEYEVPVWPTMYNHDAIDFDYLKDAFNLVRENNSYELYKRK